MVEVTETRLESLMVVALTRIDLGGRILQAGKVQAVKQRR